jgi:hypothetical protein
MGIYNVKLQFANGGDDERVVQAVTFDEAYQHAVSASPIAVVGAVVASVREPENYTIYGLGA